MKTKSTNSKKKLIKICSGHRHDETPLIWTFAFIGAEYWCPVCGYLGGMLGSGENVPLTPKLKNKLVKYRKLSKKYLKANGLLSCAYFEYKGKKRKFSEMSKWFKTYWKNRSNEWKYKYE